MSHDNDSDWENYTNDKVQAAKLRYKKLKQGYHDKDTSPEPLNKLQKQVMFDLFASINFTRCNDCLY